MARSKRQSQCASVHRSSVISANPTPAVIGAIGILKPSRGRGTSALGIKTGPSSSMIYAHAPARATVTETRVPPVEWAIAFSTKLVSCLFAASSHRRRACAEVRARSRAPDPAHSGAQTPRCARRRAEPISLAQIVVSSAIGFHGPLRSAGRQTQAGGQRAQIDDVVERRRKTGSIVSRPAPPARPGQTAQRAGRGAHVANRRWQDHSSEAARSAR